MFTVRRQFTLFCSRSVFHAARRDFFYRRLAFRQVFGLGMRNRLYSGPITRLQITRSLPLYRIRSGFHGSRVQFFTT